MGTTHASVTFVKQMPSPKEAEHNAEQLEAAIEIAGIRAEIYLENADIFFVTSDHELNRKIHLNHADDLNPDDFTLQNFLQDEGFVKKEPQKETVYRCEFPAKKISNLHTMIINEQRSLEQLIRENHIHAQVKRQGCALYIGIADQEVKKSIHNTEEKIFPYEKTFEETLFTKGFTKTDKKIDFGARSL